MPKTIIWALVVIAVVVGGYALSRGDKEVDTFNIYNNNGTEVKNESGKKMAFSEFIKKQDGAYKCTVNQSVGGTETKGTTYISQGMIRGEYNTKASGMDITSTLIVRDGYTYSWSSMMPNKGFKMKVQTDVNINPNASASGSYSFNAEQIGDYDCQPWTTDESVFKLPSGITFTDVSMTIPPSGGSSKASLCTASKGTWSEQYKECLGVNENSCKAIGGAYNGCASACRHDPKAEVCTMQCVEVCTVK